MQEVVRTCKWFDPAAMLAEKNSAVSGDVYPFDRHLAYNSCWSSDRAAAELGTVADVTLSGSMHSPIMCPHTPDEFQSCRFYTPQATDILRLGYLQTSPDNYTWVALDKTRLNYGTEEYRVVVWNQPHDYFEGFHANAFIHSAVNSQLNPQACSQIAEELFQDLVFDTATNSGSHFVDCTDSLTTKDSHAYSNLILTQRES